MKTSLGMNGLKSGIGNDSALRAKPVRDSLYFSRRFHQLNHLVFHPLARRRYIADINKFATQGLIDHIVHHRYKYLGDYLSRSFGKSTKAALILSHYRFVGHHLTEHAKREMLSDGVLLWQNAFDDHRARVLLRVNQSAMKEGEWQLQFVLDDRVISTLTFLFASERRFRTFGDVVCLIGGVQGGYACRAEIRLAAKANFEIAPMTMLILAARATASAFGVTAMFGVSSAHQIARDRETDRTKADYDAIWFDEGASYQIAGFYALSHHLIERDLKTINRTHRRRTKLKRQRKAELLGALTQDAKMRLLRRTTPALHRAG